MYCVNTAEQIDMLFRVLTLVRPRNHVLDGVKVGRTVPFAATRGDKSAMRRIAQLIWTLVIIVIIITAESTQV